MVNVLKEKMSKANYTIAINNFEGPLDLLIYLIDKEKLSIFDISLSNLTDKYIEYLEEMERLDLEIATEFLVMASSLLYIKSKRLLPDIKDEEVEEETEEDILNRIAEYKMYKNMAETLRGMYESNCGKCVKPTEHITLPKRKMEINFKISTLESIYLEIIRRNKDKINVNSSDIERLAIHEKITVKSKVKEMISFFVKKTSFVFNKMFDIEDRPKIEIVTAFIGMLELAKLKKVKIEQEIMFGDITVKKIYIDGDLDMSLIEE